MQEAALSLPRIKDPPAVAVEQYQNVLTPPLDDMLNIQVRRTETIKRGKETDTDAYEGGDQWERHPGS